MHSLLIAYIGTIECFNYNNSPQLAFFTGPSDLSRQVDIGGGSSASGSGGSISISVSSGDGVGGAFSVTAGESAAASGGSASVVAR